MESNADKFKENAIPFYSKGFGKHLISVFQKAILFSLLLYGIGAYSAMYKNRYTGASNYAWGTASNWQYSTDGGNTWNTASVAPTINDDVRIYALTSGYYSVNGNCTCNNLTIDGVSGSSTGRVYFLTGTSGSLTIAGSLTINGNLNVVNATQNNEKPGYIYLSGDLTNNGNLSLYTRSGNYYGEVYLVFRGSGNSTITQGSNSSTNFFIVEMEKASSSNTVTFNVSKDFQGMGGNNGFLNLSNKDLGPVNCSSPSSYTAARGMFTLAGTFTKTNNPVWFPGFTSYSYCYPAATNINTNATFTLDNGNFTIPGSSSDFGVYGAISILEGTLNFGTSNNHALASYDGSTISVEGGKLSCAGAFNIQGSYSQSNGSVIVAYYGNNKTTTGDFDYSGTSFDMTGGIITLVNQTTNAGNTYPHYYMHGSNVNISGGTLIIGDANGQTGEQVFSVSGETPGITLFQDNNDHSNKAVLMGDVTCYGDILIPGDCEFSLYDPNGNVPYTLTFQGVNYTQQGNLLGEVSGCRLLFNGNSDNSSQNLYLQDATFETPGINTFEINNPSDVLLYSGDILIDGNFILTDGIFIQMDDDSRIELTSNTDAVTVRSETNKSLTNCYVNGNIIKNYPVGNSQTFTYDLGTTNGYSPVTVSFNVTSEGSVYVRAYQRVDPNITPKDLWLKRYWKFINSSTVFNSNTAAFSYLNADFYNSTFTEADDETDMDWRQWNGSSWSKPSVLSRTSGGTSDGGSIEVSNLLLSGDYTGSKAYDCVGASIVTQPSTPDAICSDAGTAEISVGISGATTYEYQWQSSMDGFEWTDLTEEAPYSSAYTSGSSSTTNTLAITNPSFEYDQYQYRCVITNCGVRSVISDAVYITILQEPNQADAGDDQHLCNETSVTMTGNEPSFGLETGTWTLVSGPNTPSITDINDPYTTITGMTSGTYTFKWTIDNGACSSEDNVQVIIDAQPAAANAGSDQNLGFTSTITMNGNTPSVGTGEWSMVSGPNTPSITDPNSPSTTITGVTNGTYVFEWSITNGICNTSDNVNIAISEIPEITGTTPGSRCDAGTVTLGATASAGTINWYDVPTGGSSLGTGTSFITPSISSNTTYYADATYNGQTSETRTSVLATVNTTPSISSTTPGSHCGTGSVTLGASATSGTISWYAAASGGSSLGTGTSFDTPSISSTTTYYVDATSNGCTTPSRTPVAATIKTIPTITSTTPASRNGTGTVTLGATASAGTINWYDAATGGTSLGTGTSFITPSISETTTYYVDATNNGCTTASRTAVTATVNPLNGVLWTAEGGSTAWDDPDNWTCNCIPQSTDDITIPTHPSGGDIYPAVNITDAACKSLTISSGVSFSVSSGKNISIYGNFSNSGSSSLGAGTFTFSGSSAQTISGTNKFVNLTINNSAGVSLSGTTDITDILTLTSGTLTTNGKLTLDADLSKFAIISGDGTGSVSGNVNIQKQFPTYKRYYYISSPVTCNFSQLQSFVNITGWGASYKNGGWSNVWKYDETDISQITHPDGVWMNGWIAPSGSSEAMQPLKGYALYADAVKTTKLTLTGPVNSGQVNMSVTNTSSVGAGGHANDDGWMFVGNPYPCPIDWEATGGSWTKTNVDNAMYFFEFTTQYGGSYKSFVNGIGVPEDVTGIVAPMQGFFVHASGAGNLTVNNAARVNTTSTHFYKKTSAEKQMLRLKAYCKSTPDASDQTVIYFNNDATASYDNNFDAYKIMNNGEGYPNVYSMIDAENRLSINALPEVKENEETIPVGFKIAKNGNYIFNAAAIQNIPLTTDIYLIDMTANITQDLRTNPIYNFSASAGTTEGRFYLKFSPQTITNNYELPTTNSELINAFSTGNILNVAFSSSKSATASLHIYNLLGQDIMNPQQINSGNHTYTLEHGVYIVSIVTDSKTYTKKILIN